MVHVNKLIVLVRGWHRAGLGDIYVLVHCLRLHDYVLADVHLVEGLGIALCQFASVLQHCLDLGGGNIVDRGDNVGHVHVGVQRPFVAHDRVSGQGDLVLVFGQDVDHGLVHGGVDRLLGLGVGDNACLMGIAGGREDIGVRVPLLLLELLFQVRQGGAGRLLLGQLSRRPDGAQGRRVSVSSDNQVGQLGK